MFTLARYLAEISGTSCIEKNMHGTAYIFSTDDLHIIVDIITKRTTVLVHPSIILDCKITIDSKHLYNTVVQSYIRQNLQLFKQKFLLRSKILEKNESILDNIRNNIGNSSRNPNTNGAISNKESVSHVHQR